MIFFKFLWIHCCKMTVLAHYNGLGVVNQGFQGCGFHWHNSDDMQLLTLFSPFISPYQSFFLAVYFLGSLNDWYDNENPPLRPWLSWPPNLPLKLLEPALFPTDFHSILKQYCTWDSVHANIKSHSRFQLRPVYKVDLLKAFQYSLLFLIKPLTI